jgi:hypothetical protein
MSPRAPRASSQWPTGTAAAPATSSASENAPVTWIRDHPVSCSIGWMKTEKA